LASALDPRSAVRLGDGFALYLRRLERGTFDFPSATDACVPVTPTQLAMNRLVARSLEQQWEIALRAVRDAETEYDRAEQGHCGRTGEGRRAAAEGDADGQ
jgi:hypothetical protein